MDAHNIVIARHFSDHDAVLLTLQMINNDNILNR